MEIVQPQHHNSGTTKNKAEESVDPLLERFYTARFGFVRERIAAQIIAGVREEGRAFLGGKGVRGDQVDDLCQETSVRLLAALRKSREPGGTPITNAAAYARIIAGNLLIDQHRYQSVRPPTESIEELEQRGDRNPDAVLPPAEGDLEAEFLSREWATGQLWPVVLTLRPQQRTAWLLSREQDELLLMAGTISAVANTLDIPLAEFITLWRGVPLSDKAIAQRLGVSAQGKTTAETRVSNLRKVARETIQRRLGKQKP